MDTATTEEKFLHAVELIKNLPKSGNFQPSNELKLKFYSYFKQATEGPCSLPKPGFWDVINKTKWEAWSRLGEMTKEEAMESYVDEFIQILKTTPFDESAHNFVHLMGPYIDFAPKDFKEMYKNVNGKICDLSEVPVCNPKDIHESHKKISASNKDQNDQFKDLEKVDLHVNGHHINGTTESDSDEFSDFYDNANGGSSDEIYPISSIEKPNFNPLLASKGSNIYHARGGGEHRFVDADSNPSVPGTSGNRLNQNNRRGRTSGDSHALGHGHNWPAGASGGGRRPTNTHSNTFHEMNETLAYAVIRLQQTMDQVVNRLDSLEALLQAQNTTSAVSAVRRSFWSIIGVPPRAVFFILAWPFIVHWVMYIVIQKRRRR